MSILSHVRFLVALLTIAHQIALSMEFSRQEYQSRLPFLTPGELPDPGIKLSPLLWLLHWQVDSLPLASPEEPNNLLDKSAQTNSFVTNILNIL